MSKGSKNTSPSRRSWWRMGTGRTIVLPTWLGVLAPGPAPSSRSTILAVARTRASRARLEISAGMAKLLRSGRGWTVARLDQAIQLWPGFRDFVFAPADDRLVNRLEQLALGLARLANQIGELRQQLLADQSTCDDQAKERAA